MTKLNNDQRALLAAADANGAIDAGDGAKAVVKSLIKQGLAISAPIDGGCSRLIVTQAGHKALGASQEAPLSPPSHAVIGAETAPRPRSAVNQAASTQDAAADEVCAPEPRQEEAAAVRSPKGKIATLIALLQRPEGVTIDTMMAATGWQAHSVRGALSGAIKKKLGLDITSERVGAARIYRLGPQDAADPKAPK